MKKKLTLCLVLTILIASAAGSINASASGINNSIITGPGSGTSSVYTGSTSPWFSVNGYPSKDDIAAVGDEKRILCPKQDNYLPDYKIRFVDANEENSIYVYRNSAKNSSNPERLDHGAKVYVIAEQDTSSCIIYKTYENKARSGWVSTSLLSKSYTGRTVEIGKAYPGELLIGDSEFTYSGSYMVGTESEYLLLNKPAHSCTGFTLEYKIRKFNGDCDGERDIYINNSEGWIWVGSFRYDNPKAYHIIVHLSEPQDVYAIAAPSHASVTGSYTARQNILDMFTAK